MSGCANIPPETHPTRWRFVHGRTLNNEFRAITRKGCADPPRDDHASSRHTLHDPQFKAMHEANAALSSTEITGGLGTTRSFTGATNCDHRRTGSLSRKSH